MPKRPRGRNAGSTVAVVVLGAAAALALVGSPAGAASSDNTIEKRAVLKRTDFPAGWESSTRRAPADSGVAVCAGIDGVNEVLAPRSTRSPNFTKPDADYVLANSSVVVTKSVKEAKGFLEPYRDDDAVRCLETLTETALTQASFSAVRVYVTPTDDVPSGADEAAGFDIQITVTSAATPGQPAQTEVLYQDYVLVRVGRALANFDFRNPGKSLPEQGELVDVVIGRLEDALAR